LCKIIVLKYDLLIHSIDILERFTLGTAHRTDRGGFLRCSGATNRTDILASFSSPENLLDYPESSDNVLHGSFPHHLPK
jgi:hypothetical protein